MADTETPPAKAAASDTATAAEPAAATPEQTEETTAAPATGTTTTTVEEPGQVAGEDAVGVEGYEKEEAEFLANPEADRHASEKWEQAKAALKKDEELSEAARVAGETPAAAVAETAETAETQAAAEVPATDETAVAAAPETPAATAEDDDKDPVRIRIAGLEDSHLVASANRIARKEGVTFSEAWDRVAPKKAEPRERQSQTAATAADDAPVTTKAGRTLEQIQAAITARKAEKKQAATDIDTGKMFESDEAIDALREELSEVSAAEARAEQKRQAAERTQFEATVASSQTKANEYWPESIDKNSALSKRTLELADEYEKDPALADLVTKADSPFYFTQMAAQELGMAPKHLRKTPAASPAAATNETTPPKPATPTATKPAPKNQSAVVRPTQPAAQPASGGARTTQEGSGIDSALDKIHGVADYEKLEEQFLTGKLAVK